MAAVLSPTTGHARRASAAQIVAAVDPWLLGSLAALMAFGLVMVYSATIATADPTGGASAYYLKRHFIHLMIGLGVLAAAALTPVPWWRSVSRVLLLAGIALLALVLVPAIGVEINGSRRWIDLGFFRLQPAEPVKLFVVIYTAGYLVRKQEELRSFRTGLLAIGAVLAVLTSLLLLQPDFGSAVVIIVTVAAMLFLAGMRFLHFFLCGLGAAVGLGVLAVASPYRVDRITSFLDPWADPFNTGFQLVQALIAFGRGEWFGVGLGASVQKLFYLPHAGTDFLLAVIGEELGFIGVATVIALFTVLLWRIFAVSRRAELRGDVFGARLVQGAGLLIVLQAMIAMGVNMGVLPTKGLTLPFMSYGGSSMLSCCVAIGIVLAVDRAGVRPAKARSRAS